MTKHTPEPDIQARTVAGFCAAYGVGVTTTYALIGAGKLRTVKVGRRTLIVEASAREWFAALEQPKPLSLKAQHPAEYATWANMIQRCKNSKREDFKWYGSRGIMVCDHWLDSFSNFFNDMGPRPTPDHSIDRINNDGHYEPRNCRWATAKQQRANRRELAHVIAQTQNPASDEKRRKTANHPKGISAWALKEY